MHTFHRLLTGTSILLLLSGHLMAQTPEALSDLDYEVEAGVMLSSAKSNPFWLRSNHYGEVPLESQNFTLRGQASKE
ncbi:hypothetical protein [Persicitalea sp.]|uniref:hypothetical protein n=1 Tax=Persicitalea sp. TaxID=3100273 RepID=UPI0035930CF6